MMSDFFFIIILTQPLYSFRINETALVTRTSLYWIKKSANKRKKELKIEKK